MVTRRYGTWLDLTTGLRHFIFGIRRGKGMLGAWDSKSLCGDYVNVKPREPHAVVTCVRCLWKWLRPRESPADVLRGQTADMTVIDEAQDIDLDEIGLFSLPPPPP